MAELVVRLDDGLAAFLRRRAQRNGRPLDAEVSATLAEAMERDREARLRDRQALVRELEALAATQPPRQPGWPTLVEMIREDRDSR